MDPELMNKLDPSLYNVDSRTDLRELEVVLAKIGNVLTDDYGNKVSKADANAIAKFLDFNAFWETAWVAIPALRESFDPNNTLARPRALQHILAAVNGRMSNNVLVENLSGAEKDLITRLTDTIAFLKSLTRPQDVDERCSNTLSKLALELSDRAQKWRHIREEQRLHALQMIKARPKTVTVDTDDAEESPRVLKLKDHAGLRGNEGLLKSIKFDPFRDATPKIKKIQGGGLAGSQWAPGAPGFFADSGPREWMNAQYYQSSEPTPVKWTLTQGSAGHEAYVKEQVTDPEERRILKFQQAFDKIIGSDGSAQLEDSPVSSGNRVRTSATPEVDLDAPPSEPRLAIKPFRNFLEAVFADVPQLETTMRNVWSQAPERKTSFVRQMLELASDMSDVPLPDLEASESNVTTSPELLKLNAETLARLGSVKRGESSGDGAVDRFWEETSPHAIVRYYFRHKASMDDPESEDDVYYRSLPQPSQEELKLFIEKEIVLYPALRGALCKRLDRSYERKAQYIKLFWKAFMKQRARELEMAASTELAKLRSSSPAYKAGTSPEALDYDADTEPTPQLEGKVAQKASKSRKILEPISVAQKTPKEETQPGASSGNVTVKKHSSPPKVDTPKTPPKKQQVLAKKVANKAVEDPSRNFPVPKTEDHYSLEPEQAVRDVPAHLRKYFVPEHGGPSYDSPDAYDYDPRRGIKW